MALVSRKLYIFLVLFSLCLLFFLYKPGTTGALFYDDYGNLESLSKIQSFTDAKQFVFGGIAGPLGRPIALASFIPHAAGWPENSQSVLLVNVLLHLVNALLIGVLAYLLSGLNSVVGQNKRRDIALLTAVLWASMPLLASTSLIAIQRMTGLAASFTLLALISFLWGYRYQSTQPLKAFIVQIGALGFFTALSIFTKENGALTPVYAYVINAFACKRYPANDYLSRFRTALLLLALLVILVYLSPLMRDYSYVSEIRGYSVWDRLQTQVVVLWEYLRAALLPLPSLYGPFHDDRTAEYSGWVSFVALIAWVFLILFAWLLKVKKYTPWVLFAVVWYLAGHLIESTSIMLEIYFEHRNYIPIFGICFLFSMFVVSVHQRYAITAHVLASVYIALQMTVLYSVTSTWGEQRKAAELWSQERPGSARAVMHAIFLEMNKADVGAIADSNYNFIHQQRMNIAIDRLDRTAARCPGCIGVRLQAILYSCSLKRYEDANTRFSLLLDDVPGAKEPRSVVDSLFSLREVVKINGCPGIEEKELLVLIDSLAGSKLFKISHISTRLYFIAAAIAADMDNNGLRDEYLDKAELASPTALPVLQYQVYSALKESKYEKALDAVRRRYPVLSITSGAMTREVLDSLYDEIQTAMAADIGEQKNGK